jgi:hypothetical protein
MVTEGGRSGCNIVETNGPRVDLTESQEGERRGDVERVVSI